MYRQSVAAAREKRDGGRDVLPQRADSRRRRRARSAGERLGFNAALERADNKFLAASLDEVDVDALGAVSFVISKDRSDAFDVDFLDSLVDRFAVHVADLADVEDGVGRARVGEVGG